MKQGSGMELKGFSSFDKQESEIEYSEFKATEYTVIEKLESESVEAAELSELTEIREKEKQSSASKCFGYTVRANDTFKIWWDSIVLVIAIFNSITIPMELSFNEYRSLFDQYYYTEINTVCTGIFVMDIFLNMNTTYYDSDGDEIYSKKNIILNYMKGMFVIDTLSSIPIDKGPWKIINILKIVRVFKLPGIINKMNVDEESKSVLRMGFLVFELVICLHLIGCFWNMIVSSNDYWIPPLDFVWTGKYPYLYRFYGEDLHYRYLVHYYNAVLFLGGNEMGPRTN